MDGIPTDVRDELNRAALDDELARTEAALARTGLSDDERAELVERRDSMRSILGALDELTDGTSGSLMLFDATEVPVKVAIGIGEVDSADHVAVMTPGIGSRADREEFGGYVRELDLLRQASDEMLYQAGDESTATVLWLGYDAPGGPDDGPRIVEAGDARFGLAGAPDLASFAEGIRGLNPDAHLSALGHSYGSFVTGTALRQTDAFDSFVAFGSPGLGTTDASTLQVAEGQLFAMEADWDLVGDLGYFGTDPSRLDGMRQLSTQDSAAGDRNVWHVDYLRDGSTSQNNLAAIVSGQNEQLVAGHQSDLGDVLLAPIGSTRDVLMEGASGAMQGSRTGSGLGADVGRALWGQAGQIVGSAGGGAVGGAGGFVIGAGEQMVDGVVAGVTGVAGTAAELGKAGADGMEMIWDRVSGR